MRKGEGGKGKRGKGKGREGGKGGEKGKEGEGEGLSPLMLEVDRRHWWQYERNFLKVLHPGEASFLPFRSVAS